MLTKFIKMIYFYLSFSIQHCNLSMTPLSGCLDLTDVSPPPDGCSHHRVEVGHQGQGQEVLEYTQSQTVVVERCAHVWK